MESKLPRYLESAAVSVAMIASSLAAYQLTPTIKVADSRPKVSLAELFPSAFGDWKLDAASPIVLPSADVQANLNKIYNQVLTRTYVNGSGYRIMLSVAYGGDQSDGLTVHRPEICYPAQGFEVSKISEESLMLEGHSIPVTRLVTKKATRTEPVTYWVVNGDVAVGKRFDARLVQLRYGLKGLIPDGMLIRISSIDIDPANAFSVQSGFASELAASLPESRRARIGVS